MQIKLTVLGDPKAQKRPKFTRQGKFVRAYDPSAKDKDNLLSVIYAQAPKNPLDEPIELNLAFYMSRPKGHYGSGKNSCMLKESAPEFHTSRPDIDNLIKMVLDALNGVFYRDDSVIFNLHAIKVYAERPRTEILIITL